VIEDPFRLEFGRYTEWIVEAAAAVGVADPIPVACRGTANVALFEDMADAIGARRGMKVLDVGCGMGGPAAWLRRARGCDVVGIDLMEESVVAARGLFGQVASVVGSTSALPFRARSFAAVWAVGVLEMVKDKAAALRETARVLEPGGRAAFYSFTTTAEALEDPPTSDHFVSPEAVASLAEHAGLDVRRAAPAAHPRVLDDGWSETRATVEAEIRRRHASEPEFAAVRKELGRFARLTAAAAVEPWRFDLVLPGGRQGGSVSF
jgi:SAM-dependent methyltransferase